VKVLNLGFVIHYEPCYELSVVICHARLMTFKTVAGKYSCNYFSIILFTDKKSFTLATPFEVWRDILLSVC